MTVATALSPLQRLEVREACERLALDYSHLADAARMDEWSQLFAEDGEMHLFGQVHKGRAAIRGAVGAGSASTALSVHAITNHRIDVLSEDEAEGTAYVMVFTGEKKADGGPATVAQIAPLMVGIYHDKYKRTGQGWKFAKRAFQPLIATAQS